MLKTTLFLFIATFLISCGKSSNNTGSDYVGDAVALEEISVDSPVPYAAQNFSTNIRMENFNSTQEDKVLQAAELIKQVIASEEFKRRVLNFKFKGKKRFVDNGGLSNAQIYKKIVEGSEKLRPGVDNTMDLELKIYRANNMTVGYTYPNVLSVWMNSKYLNKNKPAEVTTNMMHEWLHKLGFKHDKARTPTRKYSVPYAVGYIVRNMARKLN